MRTRIPALTLTLGLLALASPAHAQTLEETYANLCRAPAAAKSEACVALRRALVAKLSGESAAAPPAAAPVTAGASSAPSAPSVANGGSATQALPGASSASPASASAIDPPAAAPAEVPADWKARFGPYAAAAGKTYFSRSGAFTDTATYEWKEPGRVLVMTSQLADGSSRSVTTMSFDPATNRLVSESRTPAGTETVYASVQPDGSILYPPGKSPDHRSIVRALPDGELEFVVERREGRRWVKALTVVQRVYSEEALAADLARDVK